MGQIPTQRLYYEDAYLQKFTATVTGCEAQKDGFTVTLDRTAFYPEGGGQPADHGILGDAKVLDVQEQGGRLLHTTDRPLEVGTTVEGIIDWPRRFLFMQQHTGEHIVSGITHRLFQWNNVGFHRGDVYKRQCIYCMERFRGLCRGPYWGMNLSERSLLLEKV